MVFTSKIDGASVAERKALEHEYEDSSAERRVLGARKPAKEFIATSEDDQMFLSEVTRCDSFAPRLEIVKDLLALGYRLAVKHLFYQPEEEGRVAMFVVG